MRVLASCVLVAAALVSCKGGKSKLDDNVTSPGSGPTGGSASAKSVDLPPKPTEVTSKRADPQIHELGMDHVVPTAIVIELATPIVDRDLIGSVSSKSQVKVTPEVPGSLSYTGVSEVTFTPARQFDYATTYTINVERLETRDGLIEPPAGIKWSYTFKTEDFKFLSWAPSGLDLANHKVTTEVTFSGPVLPNIAKAMMTFTVNGHAATGVAMLPTHSPNIVVVQLSDPKLVLGAKLSFALKAGLPSLQSAKAAAATAEYIVATDKGVSIKNAYMVEGSNGFYMEVVCNDDAAAKGHRYAYEGEAYDDLSERCQLTDEAISRIHFSPPVKKMYITNGKAGFRVFGEFKRGTYAVKVDGGATSVDGGMLLAPFSKSFSVAARKPTISFQGTGRYLPRTAWTNLGIKQLNVDAVNLIVREVPPENLIFWLSNDYSDAPDERTSNVILKKEIALKSDPDTQSTTWLDVASLLPATSRGILEMRLVATGTTASARLLLTNMSLVAKKSTTPGKPWDQKVLVWALDMDTANALSDVEVSLVRKSGKVVAKCSTQGTTGCTLSTNADSDPDRSEPFALIARKGDDLTYIRYADLKADVAESSTSGTPFVLDSPYRAAMYSDRGVYRPGETAHVTAIVRDARDQAPAQPLPVDVTVVDPRAKVVKRLVLKTNAAGMINLDQALPAFADTGHWRVALAVAEKPLAAYDVQVEEFVPERMKVTAAPKQPDMLIGDKIAIDVSAQYLFGGTAADSGVELACTAKPSRFSPPENADLTYGVEPKGKSVTLGEATKDQLDPKGELSISCPDDAAKTTFTQTSEVIAVASVLEAGSGRATVKSTTVTLHPETFYLGLRSKTSQAEAGVPFTVEGVVVDWKGKPVANAVTNIEIELDHLEADYGYSYDEDNGEGRYDRWLRKVPEGKKTARVAGGKFTFDVTPADADVGFVVRVKAGKAKTELVLQGSYPYSYSYGGYGEDRVDQTPRPAKPTQLALQLAKEIEVGKPVSVKVLTPYNGKILWTVETDHVITAEWKDVTRGEATWSFTLSDFAPNVYVSAFVVKDPHLESKAAFLPDRAFGLSSARVLPTLFTQSLKIDVPKDVRSSSPLVVKLDAGTVQGPAFATVAVVDEGVLSLTSFKSPDPLSVLFARRSLAVETFETIGWTMLHNPAGASSRTGGGDDGMADAEQGALGKGRVQPVKPVALFSGVVAVGADGKITIPFQIPSYRGQVRVMAVVASAGRVGRAEAEVTVKDPVVIQTTFPRFLTQNDEIQIPVFVTNLSGGPLTINIKLDSTDLPIVGLVKPKNSPAPLSFAGKNTGSLKLENGKNDTIVFQAKAMIPVGGAKLTVTATAGNLTVKDELEVPFLPAGPKDHVIQKLRVDAGQLDLSKQPVLKNWVPTSESTTFWLTTNPYSDAFAHLSYLVHYPYGCIEQTASATRPLLYLGSIVEDVDPELAELKIEDMVLAGITRIFSMETPSGGFGYWPGSADPLEWATAYATDTLLDAKKAGYAVPEDRLKEVIGWIDGRVTAYERGEKVAHEKWNHYDEQSEAYLHYVLARAGRGKKGRIQALINAIPKSPKGEQAEDLYLLKAALYLAGDRRYAAELKAVDATPIAPERINSWSFYSDRRARGLELSTFFELFGAVPEGEALANRVAESLASEPGWGYWNTQELVWGVTGLGKWVTATRGKGVAAGTLTADGAVINPRANKHKSTDKTWSLVRASEYKNLTIDIPQSAAGLFLMMSSDGVRPGRDFKTGGNGMSVSRTYKTLDSTEVDLTKGTLHLGDLVFVEVEIENTSGATIQNIALVDRLPAGFEIENPRLGRATKPDWVKDAEQWGADFMNMRDDRLEAFGSLPPHTSKKLVYTVRAVTAGKFTMPPIEAEAMYDATLWARSKGGTVVVAGPWTGKLL